MEQPDQSKTQRKQAMTALQKLGMELVALKKSQIDQLNLPEQLLDAVWGSGVYVDARTVDVHIGRLRKAVNEQGDVDPIRTVRSAGYALDESFQA